MHLNYYYLRQLTPALENKLRGWELATAFSQEKDELVLGFCSANAEFYLKAILKPEFTLLTYPEDFRRARRNSVDLFTPLFGQRVEAAIQYQNERSFALQFTGGSLLLFKLHGNRSNVILFSPDQPPELFHHRLAEDAALNPNHLHRTDLDQTWENFERQQGNVQKLFPTFGKRVLQYLNEQFVTTPSLTQRWQLVQQTVQRLENPAAFYLTYLGSEPALTLLPLGEVESETTDPLEAANRLWSFYTRTHLLEREREAVLRHLDKQLARSESYLLSGYEKLEELASGSRHEQTANLLMANLHLVPSGAESVSVTDFYHDNRPVKIKLNKDLSPQKNAERYYRKAKNEAIELTRLQTALAGKEAEVKALAQHRLAIATADSLKGLRKYTKENGLMGEKAAETPTELFRQFEHQHFQIWVGKNAKNNDLLTQQYAHKDDLWLHAKDVTGSHVIVKQQSGKPFPEPVVERAAELAAWFSRRRNDTVCSVTVTPRKFVRKPKGLPPGAVVVDQEKIILVKPSL